MGIARAMGQRTRGLGELTRSRPALLTLCAVILPTIVYLQTMAPTVYGLDSAELSVGAYTLGLVHQPGYPLYLLLGKLFTLLPVGDVGYRLNLMSAVFGILTVLLVYVVACRLTGQPVAALGAALFLAFSWYFWTDAIVAEVYTLQAALTVGLLWVLLVWREVTSAHTPERDHQLGVEVEKRVMTRRHALISFGHEIPSMERVTARQSAGQDRRPHLLYAFAFLAGLGFANYPATGLLAPGFVAFIWLTDRRALLSPRRLAAMAALFGAGCLVYLYLPLRYLAGPAFNYMGRYDASGVFHPLNLTDPATLWWSLTGGPFQGLMFGYRFSELMHQAGQYLYFLWGNFLAVGLPLGLMGLIHGWQRDRTIAISTGLVYIIYTIFFINYRVVDKHTMFLPTYVIWALWIAWGYQALVEWAGAAWRPALQTAFLAVAAVAFFVNFPLADVSWDRRAYENAANMLAAVEPDALVLADWGYAAPMAYLQLTERRRPDVQVINRFFISFSDTRRLIDRAIQSRPVYVVSVEPDRTTESMYELEAAGPGFRILSIK